MRKYATGLAVLFALALPAAAQDAAAAAVVKKAIDAHGGTAALDKTKTARSKSKGTMTQFDTDIAFVATSVYSLPDKFKLEMAAEVRGAKLTATQVVNGKQVKVKSALAGTDQPVSDKAKEETAQAVLVQEVTTLTPLVAAGSKYTLKAEKDADADGKPASVVLVTGNGIKDVRLYFDKATGLLVKTMRKGVAATAAGLVDVQEESTLSDYKKVGDALLPMKLVVKQDGKKFMDVTVTEVTTLDKVPPEEFEVK